MNKFLTAYRTTPHCTTGKAPDEMLFKRRLHTKIPKLVSFDRLDEDVRDKDAIIKQKGKEYGDDKRNARSSNLNVNDKMLLQQKKSCKTMTTYEHDPYDTVNVNGSQVTVRSSEGVLYKHNSSHVRKFEEGNSQLEQGTLDHVELENHESRSPQTSNEEHLLDKSQTVRCSSRSTKGKPPDS